PIAPTTHVPGPHPAADRARGGLSDRRGAFGRDWCPLEQPRSLRSARPQPSGDRGAPELVVGPAEPALCPYISRRKTLASSSGRGGESCLHSRSFIGIGSPAVWRCSIG